MGNIADGHIEQPEDDFRGSLKSKLETSEKKAQLDGWKVTDIGYFCMFDIETTNWLYRTC